MEVMKEKISDLIYATRTLCETLRDRADLEKDEEIKDFLEEVEAALDKFADEEEEDLE
jgi:hypothetical protein